MNQYSNDDYSQGFSQLMIETIEPQEPTVQQIIAYAQQVLGMTLPEDEPLLYLSKQAITANVSSEYQIYQRSNGEIYYKNIVTQQKLFTHPSDLFYQKKYKQEKQKLLSQRKVIRYLQKINEDEQYSQSPQFSNRIQDYELEIAKYESDKNRQLKDIEQQYQTMFENFEKVERQKHRQKILTLYRQDKIDKVSNEKQFQKTRIQKQMKQHYDNKYELSRRQLIQQLNKLKQSQQKKEQLEIQSQKLNYLKQIQIKINLKQQQYQTTKQQLESQKLNYMSQLIRSQTQIKNKTLLNISQLISNKIHKLNQQKSIQTNLQIQQLHNKLNKQYNNTSNLLRNQSQNNRNQQIVQMNRLKQISDKKIQNLRKKEMQLIEKQFRQLQLNKKENLKKTKAMFYQQNTNKILEHCKEQQFLKINQLKSQLHNIQQSSIKKDSLMRVTKFIDPKNTLKAQAVQLKDKFKSLNKNKSILKKQMQDFSKCFDLVSAQRKILRLNKDDNFDQISKILLQFTSKSISQKQLSLQSDQLLEIKMFAEKLQQDRSFLHQVKLYMNQTAYQPFSQRLKIKKMNISDSEKIKRLNVVSQSNIQIKKKYQKDLQILILNEQKLVEYYKNKDNKMPQYIQLNLRKSSNIKTVNDKQKTAFFGLTMNNTNQTQRKIVQTVSKFRGQINKHISKMRVNSLYI